LISKEAKSCIHSALQKNNDKPGTIETNIQKEAERLGALYGITGKWNSFVAVDQTNELETMTRSYKAKRFDLALLTKARNTFPGSTTLGHTLPYDDANTWGLTGSFNSPRPLSAKLTFGALGHSRGEDDLEDDFRNS